MLTAESSSKIRVENGALDLYKGDLTNTDFSGPTGVKTYICSVFKKIIGNEDLEKVPQQFRRRSQNGFY